MGAQMNIKSAEAYAIASELVGLTGQSLTHVVLEALRAQRSRLTREAKIAEIREYCRETRAMMSPELLAINMDDYLYDENGLPK